MPKMKIDQPSSNLNQGLDVHGKNCWGIFITELGADKVDCLLADREFISEDWFNYFTDSGINFVIRVKCNIWMDVESVSVKSGKLFS